MNHLGTMYATKRRRRNIKRNQPKDGQTKTNPSKRHRERLNAELDLLASLLPFEQSVLSKLDKLSILRLSVSYLRTKSYFQCILNKEREASAITNVLNNSNSSNSSNSNISNSSSHLAHLSHQLNNLQTATNTSTIQQATTFQSNSQLIPYNQHLAHNAAQLKYNREYIENLLEGDLILQALNGFLFIITCDGVVFYISNTVETYLGYPQSDVCHQSVYDLVHSEDREELQRHLNWISSLPNDRTNMTLNEALRPENSQYLERNFTVRFRCLLDNTSGFLRLEIRGRIKVLHGQNLKALDDNNYNQSTPLALFAVCTPFGPPSLLEMPSKENLFKSKHRLDFSWIQLDARGRQLLGYNETDLVNRSCYDLVHYDDLSYVSSAHQELIKTGASGLIAYRLCTKNTESWQWLQTSARLIYKNSKADFILCTHRPLMEEEGRDLYGKRTMDFKVTYLDGGLSAMSTDRNFDCLTGEKSVDDRSTIINNSSSSTKSNKTRKIKAEKNTQQNLKNSILNHHSTSLTTAAAFAAINSTINPNNLTNTNNYEHALNYSNNQTNNLAQSNRYNTASLAAVDYYGNHSTTYANAYANSTTGYPNYNAQTNVTIINNNYNLNVTPQSNSALNNSTAMHLPATTTGPNITANTLLNENSSCSSNSSFSSCSTALIRKKFINQTNSTEDYDQFNQLINGHTNSHVFHSAATSNQQQPNNNHQQTHHHHLNNTNHLNLNLNQLNSINQLNQNTILNNNSFNTNSNSFNGFIYSPPHQQANLSPNNDTQLNTTNNTTNSIINNQSHNQQFSSPSSTPVHLNHDQTNQLSPLSTASNSNQLEQQVVINMDTSNSTTHQTLNHHLNNSNSINDLVGSPQTANIIISNPSTSPSNSSSSINTNLSINSSTSPQSAVALPLAYNHAPHFLHYSRLSTYYPEYHLYNYFEPKFKNTVGNNLIGNNLISNNNLFSNEHNLFINNSSTNVF